AGVGHHRRRADQTDDDHGGRRARLARAGHPVCGALPGDELPPRAPGAPPRAAPRPRAGMNVVTARGLHTRRGTTEVLRGIDLEVRGGEVVAVVGPSGSGKTTLLRALNYLTPFTAGEVEIAGHALRPGMSERADADALRAVRTRVGMVFQSFNLFPHLTALANVTEAPRRVLGLDATAAAARAGGPWKAGRPPRCWSGRRRRRRGRCSGWPTAGAEDCVARPGDPAPSGARSCSLSRLLVSSRPLGAGDRITQRACRAIGMRFSR